MSAQATSARLHAEACLDAIARNGETFVSGLGLTGEERQALEAAAVERGLFVYEEWCDDIGFFIYAEPPGEDSQTGLPDWAAFEQALAVHAETSPLSLVKVDVNRMHRVNDRLGSEAADQLIVAVADVLERFCRPGELCCRDFGRNDAFSLLLPGTDAARLAERVAELEQMLERIELPSELSRAYEGTMVGHSARQADEPAAAVRWRAAAGLFEQKRARNERERPGGRRRSRLP